MWKRTSIGVRRIVQVLNNGMWNALIFLDFFLLPTCTIGNNDRDLLAANIAPTEVLGAVVLAWGSTILFSSVMVTVGLGNREVTRDLMTMTRIGKMRTKHTDTE